MENKPEKVFAEGMAFFEPSDSAPDFIKGTLSVNVEKFNEFLKNNMQYVSDKGYMKLDIKKSQKGSCYVEVNTYKKDGVEKETVYPEGYPSPKVEGVNPDDIPF